MGICSFILPSMYKIKTAYERGQEEAMRKRFAKRYRQAQKKANAKQFKLELSSA
jgi:hypothetical protein